MARSYAGAARSLNRVTYTAEAPRATVPASQLLSPWQVISAEATARRPRWFLGVGIAFALVSIPFGFPTGREVIVGWVLLLLLAACGGEWPVWRRAVVHDWLPLIAVLFLYDLLRGFADEVGSRLWGSLPALDNGKDGAAGIDNAHVLPQLRADEWLFGWFTGGEVPTVWLQDGLYDPGNVQWYDVAVVPVYMSHFVVPMALAVALWVSAYALFRRYVWTLVSLTVVTLATYAAFPAAPPWMASLNGHLPEGVDRVPSVTLQSTGIGTIRSAVERGEAAYANAVAAIPSLHSAVPMMVLLFAWPSTPSWDGSGSRGRVRRRLALLPAPAEELPRLSGAPVRHRGSRVSHRAACRGERNRTHGRQARVHAAAYCSR
jgi:hypothetical protein